MTEYDKKIAERKKKKKKTSLCRHVDRYHV